MYSFDNFNEPLKHRQLRSVRDVSLGLPIPVASSAAAEARSEVTPTGGNAYSNIAWHARLLSPSAHYVLCERIPVSPRDPENYYQRKIALHWDKRCYTIHDAYRHVQAGFLAGVIGSTICVLTFDCDHLKDPATGEIIQLANPAPLLERLRADGIAHCVYQNPLSLGWHVNVLYFDKPQGNWIWELDTACGGDVRHAHGYFIVWDWETFVYGWVPGKPCTAAWIADNVDRHNRSGSGKRQQRTYQGRHTRLYKAVFRAICQGKSADGPEVQAAVDEALASGLIRDREFQRQIDRGIEHALAANMRRVERKTSRQRSQTTEAAWNVQRIETPKFDSADIRLDLPYVSDLDLSQLDEKIVALRSGLGTGKTELLKRYLDSREDHPSVLVITPFEQLSVAAARRFNIESYKSIDKKAMPAAPRLAICAKSLPRLVGQNGKIEKRSIVFIDEFDQQIAQLLSPRIYKNGEAEDVVAALKTILSQADTVVATSAHLSQLDVDLLQEFAGRDVLAIDNAHRQKLPALTLVNRRDAVISRAIDSAMSDSGKPTLVACGSRSTAREVKALAKQRGLPESDIFEFNSRTSSTDGARRMASDPNTEIPKYRLVIFTFAAGVGMDYTGPCDAAFGIFDNNQMAPAASMQMLARARHADRYVAYVRSHNTRAPLTAAQLRSRALDRASETAHRQGKQFQCRDGESALLDLMTRRAALSNHTRSDTLSHFVAYAQERGHAVTFQTAAYDETLHTSLKAIRAALKQYDEEMTLASAPIGKRAFDMLRLTGALEPQHFYGRERNRIEQFTNLEISPDTYRRFLTPQKRKALATFTDLIHASNEDLKTADIGESHNRVPLLYRSHLQTRHDLAEKLLLQAGNSNSIRGAIKNLSSNPIRREELLRRCAKFRANDLDTALNIFDRRSDGSQDPFKQLVWLIEQIGLKLIPDRETTKDPVDEKRHYRYKLDADEVAMMHLYAYQRAKKIYPEAVANIDAADASRLGLPTGLNFPKQDVECAESLSDPPEKVEFGSGGRRNGKPPV